MPSPQRQQHGNNEETRDPGGGTETPEGTAGAVAGPENTGNSKPIHPEHQNRQDEGKLGLLAGRRIFYNRAGVRPHWQVRIRCNQKKEKKGVLHRHCACPRENLGHALRLFCDRECCAKNLRRAWRAAGHRNFESRLFSDTRRRCTGWSCGRPRGFCNRAVLRCSASRNASVPVPGRSAVAAQIRDAVRLSENPRRSWPAWGLQKFG
jgi:hypothetical protein